MSILKKLFFLLIAASFLISPVTAIGADNGRKTYKQHEIAIQGSNKGIKELPVDTTAQPTTCPKSPMQWKYKPSLCNFGAALLTTFTYTSALFLHLVTKNSIKSGNFNSNLNVSIFGAILTSLFASQPIIYALHQYEKAEAFRMMPLTKAQPCANTLIARGHLALGANIGAILLAYYVAANAVGIKT